MAMEDARTLQEMFQEKSPPQEKVHCFKCCDCKDGDGLDIIDMTECIYQNETLSCTEESVDHCEREGLLPPPPPPPPPPPSSVDENVFPIQPAVAEEVLRILRKTDSNMPFCVIPKRRLCEITLQNQQTVEIFEQDEYLPNFQGSKPHKIKINASQAFMHFWSQESCEEVTDLIFEKNTTKINVLAMMSLCGSKLQRVCLETNEISIEFLSSMLAHGVPELRMVVGKCKSVKDECYADYVPKKTAFGLMKVFYFQTQNKINLKRVLTLINKCVGLEDLTINCDDKLPILRSVNFSSLQRFSTNVSSPFFFAQIRSNNSTVSFFVGNKKISVGRYSYVLTRAKNKKTHHITNNNDLIHVLATDSSWTMLSVKDCCNFDFLQTVLEKNPTACANITHLQVDMVPPRLLSCFPKLIEVTVTFQTAKPGDIFSVFQNLPKTVSTCRCHILKMTTMEINCDFSQIKHIHNVFLDTLPNKQVVKLVCAMTSMPNLQKLKLKELVPLDSKKKLPWSSRNKTVLECEHSSLYLRGNVLRFFLKIIVQGKELQQITDLEFMTSLSQNREKKRRKQK
jgi:hypothetical protein